MATLEAYRQNSEQTQANDKSDNHGYPFPMRSKPEENQKLAAMHRRVIDKGVTGPYQPTFSEGDGVDPELEFVRDGPVAVEVGVLVLVIKVVTVPPAPELKPAAEQ
jgi:hypothetical protein